MRTLIALGATLLVSMAPAAGPAMAADEPNLAAAWEALPKYQYGQDLAPLLAVDRAAIAARSSVAARADLAAKLAALLRSPNTTAEARQYICLRLRDVGTAAEVPMLAEMLGNPQTCEIARWALEAIPDKASSDALRSALATAPNELLVGIINSTGARRDAKAVSRLKALVLFSADERVQQAALGALGKIATEEAADFLKQCADREKIPTPQHLAVPLLRSAGTLTSSGKAEMAKQIYTLLSREGQDVGVRRAALEGLLRLEGGQATATILDWFAGSDPQRRAVAAGHLDRITTPQLEQMAKRPAMPDASRLVLLEVLASRKSHDILPLLMSLAKGDDPALRAFGIRALGSIGDASAVPFLMESLSAGGDVTEAAQQALCQLPRKAVKPVLLAALNGRPEIRTAVIEVLGQIKCYEAIDPLIALAQGNDPSVYGPAMDGLRGIADPDKTDLPRLIELVARVPRGAQRDEAEKTVVLVCEKLAAGVDHAEAVIATTKIDIAKQAEYLPLLGRLGGPKALAILQAGISSGEPPIRDGAVRGLCNWPDAEVADQLLKIAGHGDDPSHRRWALRAYIRVTTLKSTRTARQTLAMLEQAMKLASHADDRRLILERVGTMRNRDAILWLARYLDDPGLSQAACTAILEAAHDRSLRSTNQNQLGPILEKVGRISTDPATRERARQYQLGL